MEQLKIFNFKQNEVRTVLKDDEPWFVVKDVCDVLEVSNPSKAVSRLDEDERSNFKLGRQGEVNIINESGLYSLVLSSRKPEAKEFKRWVTHEVIPSIRKHGAYMTDQTLEKALTSPDFLIKLATNLKEEQVRRLEAEQKVKEQKPKVLFADAVETSQSSILVGELAKILKQNGVEIGQKRLFEWLRDTGYLIKKIGEEFNNPTQKSMELGLFEIKKSAINNPDGSIRVTKTPKVTGKGQVYFINKFLNHIEGR
ncbi:phage repressor protein/antirepressor Ant [Bacillus sp. 7504-2]|nr:phage repressor protein/antirepressor Ant [Bacillus sp. 7504-2]